MEFAIGGDLAEKEDEQIDFEAWDYHWVNKPGNLTWYTLIDTQLTNLTCSMRRDFVGHCK